LGQLVRHVDAFLLFNEWEVRKRKVLFYTRKTFFFPISSLQFLSQETRFSQENMATIKFRKVTPKLPKLNGGEILFRIFSKCGAIAILRRFFPQISPLLLPSPTAAVKLNHRSQVATRVQTVAVVKNEFAQFSIAWPHFLPASCANPDPRGAGDYKKGYPGGDRSILLQHQHQLRGVTVQSVCERTAVPRWVHYIT
jgi:hypothetical protein